MSRSFTRSRGFAGVLSLGAFLASGSALAQEPAASASPEPASPPEAEPDIQSLRARPRQGTAYALQGRQLAVTGDAMGTNGNDIFGSLGVQYGFGHGFELGSNLLHMTVGLINLSLKWNYLEIGSWAFSAEFAPTWGHGDWIWIAEDKYGIVGDTNIFILPFVATTSWQATNWFGADLGLSFVDSEILGDANGESLIFNANLALRRFSVNPQVRFNFHKRMTAYVSAQLPVWASLPGSVEAEVELEPGVVVGGQTSGSRTVPFDELYQVTVGARSMVGDEVFLSFALSYSAVAKTLYGSSISPRWGFEMRF